MKNRRGFIRYQTFDLMRNVPLRAVICINKNSRKIYSKFCQLYFQQVLTKAKLCDIIILLHEIPQ